MSNTTLVNYWEEDEREEREENIDLTSPRMLLPPLLLRLRSIAERRQLIFQHFHRDRRGREKEEEEGRRCVYDYQACKLKFRLRALISCFCCVQTSHVALIADSRGNSGT